MKNLVLTLSLFLAATFAVTAQGKPVPAANATAAPASQATISLDKEVHDYGTIENGSNGTCIFTITNTGTEPLIISRAKGSCGCTVPDWPREAIAPGASAEMKVTYDTKRTGAINKSVTITSNAGNTPTKVVRIKGSVKAKSVPAVATPAN
ncbi:DUF1573 domain-containing protein [Flavobacteriales bacterium]|jgi:hypothetical protein|nr:DUF1573 domain-containing protein [Flavobacteriales bacterium]|tara:strand:- start:293 stop:745 length:453 start_codon:yes stop_codon:yes gene_type:complete